MAERDIAQRLWQERRFWTPGIETHAEYSSPEQEILNTAWADYAATERVTPSPGVYGVLTVPEGASPQVFASVDLCEVVRQTAISCHAAGGRELGPEDPLHPYAAGDVTEKLDVASVVCALINADLVPPVDGIEEISGILSDLRKQGAYIVANTSTLPGCEVATIRFLQKYLPDSFDGLLLPGNFDGSLPLTKGHAACSTIQLLRPEEGEVVAAHVDDRPYHNVAFLREVGCQPDVTVAAFMPASPGEPMLETPGIYGAPTPLGAIRTMRDFLQPHLL